MSNGGARTRTPAATAIQIETKEGIDNRLIGQRTVETGQFLGTLPFGFREPRLKGVPARAGRWKGLQGRPVVAGPCTLRVRCYPLAEFHRGELPWTKERAPAS